MSDLKEKHVSDKDGNPAGGHTSGVGIEIDWQNGPLGRGKDRKAANGAFVEEVLKAARGRLQYYQNSRFECKENQGAIGYIGRALETLTQRTQAREARKVEGTHEV